MRVRIREPRHEAARTSHELQERQWEPRVAAPLARHLIVWSFSQLLM